MKKILIFILIVIVLIFAYGQYKDYQRFHPKNANITASKNIDLNYHNPSTVSNYFEAIEAANNYMQMQWSVNNIDVRSPENDDETTTLAVNQYGKKIAKVNFYKAILEQSQSLKKEGLNNNDIKLLESKNLSFSDLRETETASKYKAMIKEMLPERTLYSGEKSAFIYEMQKLLVAKGFDIPIDGVYQKKTSDALKTFEEKNNLFPDGKIDAMSLDLLLN
ncbi:peptidoglycan-binding domain-containing protein [Lacinutrix sp. MedPE-SW]|uniref:peptidoglycan-binding domain-containing protein n=1 Tax=Lacinutrix sp. MedPE-SW TaxID=1860087 RepID=UPI00091CF212|nr:peptidoglycan-binding domain-containing protein [Lacinutrix sp. MedPE-SW]OIQ23413.1 MAG: hypothetical protein BM549_02270 [Lacinutrix sp. MedPE-SW]